MAGFNHEGATRGMNDMGQGKRLAGDVIFLYRGLIHETGEAETFFSNPKTSEARKYLQGDILE